MKLYTLTDKNNPNYKNFWTSNLNVLIEDWKMAYACDRNFYKVDDEVEILCFDMLNMKSLNTEDYDDYFKKSAKLIKKFKLVEDFFDSFEKYEFEREHGREGQLKWEEINLI